MRLFDSVKDAMAKIYKPENPLRHDAAALFYNEKEVFP